MTVKEPVALATAQAQVWARAQARAQAQALVLAQASFCTAGLNRKTLSNQCCSAHRSDHWDIHHNRRHHPSHCSSTEVWLVGLDLGLGELESALALESALGLVALGLASALAKICMSSQNYNSLSNLCCNVHH